MTGTTQIIRIRRSSTPGAVPTVTAGPAQIQEGELALNVTDGKLFFIRNNGIPTVIAVGNYTESSIAPGSANDGDRWLNTASGILFTWTVDANGGQWVEL